MMTTRPQKTAKFAILSHGHAGFPNRVKRSEGGDTTPRLAHSESSERRVYKPQFRQKRKRSRSPAGPRRLGTATRMSASLSRRLSAFFESASGQGSKAAKFAVLTPGPGMFVNVRNTPRVVIAAPSETPVFRRVSPCVRFFEQSRVSVPAFRSESERGAFVREVEKRHEKRLGDKIYGCSFAEFSPSADSEGSQRTGKCMYIKAWRNQGLQMRQSEQFRWRQRATHVAEGGEAPVSTCEPLCEIFL